MLTTNYNIIENTKMCPKCNNIIYYKNKLTTLLGIKKNSCCKKCAASKSLPVGMFEKNNNWYRICPTCNKEISYNNKDNAKWHYKQQYDCKKCSAIKRGPRNEITKLKISRSLIGIPLSIERRSKIQKTLKQKFNTLEFKQKLSEIHSGKGNGMYGKHHSVETRKKLRILNIERVSKLKFNGKQLKPAFNINACSLIDEYGTQYGYNFQHALNGGEFYIKELGYWVDGYDKEKNIVLEIDESHHFDIYGNLHKKDVNRQKEIEEFLKCKFVRLINKKEK
jgi:hypothetical protein